MESDYENNDRRVNERDRMIKLEMVAKQISEELKKIQEHNSKFIDQYSNHLEQNNISFNEVGKTLIGLTAALETTRSSISDLKDTTKSLVEIQNQLLNQMNIVDTQTKNMDSLYSEVSVLKSKIDLLEKLEAKLQGSWKAFATGISILAFVISTAVSIGFLKMTPPEVQPTITPERIEKMIQESIKLKQGK